LVSVARRAWDLDISRAPLSGSILVRSESSFGYGRASYELNLGCNYDCEHCYLGLKRFDGLSWPNRERLLHIIRDAGVLWLQLTSGEPMIDRLFAQVYSLAYELGMMLTILSNGSRLSNPKILDLLTSRRPPSDRCSLGRCLRSCSTPSWTSLTRTDFPIRQRPALVEQKNERVVVEEIVHEPGLR
jgi:organic radical activating enzyme